MLHQWLGQLKHLFAIRWDSKNWFFQWGRTFSRISVLLTFCNGQIGLYIFELILTCCLGDTSENSW
jgi:hypothetical protein